jgi:heme/copper-type cytochrome/quinol oxidase subunit 1
MKPFSTVIVGLLLLVGAVVMITIGYLKEYKTETIDTSDNTLWQALINVGTVIAAVGVLLMLIGIYQQWRRNQN